MIQASPGTGDNLTSLMIPGAVNELDQADYLLNRKLLLDAFLHAREHTIELTTSLSAEDMGIQPMPDASPTKWHLAHTTWFFETFILEPNADGFQWFNPGFCELFNSYYNGIGSQFPRSCRGMLSRPGLEEVLEYRETVNQAISELVKTSDESLWTTIAPMLVLGINHEQQHQELMLTDIKFALFRNPMFPAFAAVNNREITASPMKWHDFDGGSAETGHAGPGFCFDNELPRHQQLLTPFRWASRAVNNSEWLDFMRDGGYDNPLLWLSEGWDWKETESVKAPLYWCSPHGDWQVFTLSGLRDIDPNVPVSHISYYEADAFARWGGHRLPTEHEWEYAMCQSADQELATQQDWHWTASAYLPYPGYQPETGAVGEYNGKFMINQMVLRGRSRATPAGHSRPQYRNFFSPSARWQFSGLRLASDRGT